MVLPQISVRIEPVPYRDPGRPDRVDKDRDSRIHPSRETTEFHRTSLDRDVDRILSPPLETGDDHAADHTVRDGGDDLLVPDPVLKAHDLRAGEHRCVLAADLGSVGRLRGDEDVVELLTGAQARHDVEVVHGLTPSSGQAKTVATNNRCIPLTRDCDHVSDGRETSRYREPDRARAEHCDPHDSLNVPHRIA